MPFYPYKCDKCNKEWDMFLASEKSKTPECPDCGWKLTRLISSTLPPKFNGKGFYETDYKKEE